MRRLPAILSATLLAATVSAAAQSVQQRFAVPDGGWDYVSFDPASHRVFVGRSDGVLTVDVATGKVTGQLVAATRTHAALALGDTGLGAVTSTAAGGVIVFDAATGAVKATLPTGPKPDAAVFDPATKTLMVLDNKVGTVTIVDPVAAKVIGVAKIGGALEAGALDRRGHLFVTVEDGGAIADVDLKATTVARRFALPGCEEPGGLALTDAGVLGGFNRSSQHSLRRKLRWTRRSGVRTGRGGSLCGRRDVLGLLGVRIDGSSGQRLLRADRARMRQ